MLSLGCGGGGGAPRPPGAAAQGKGGRGSGRRMRGEERIKKQKATRKYFFLHIYLLNIYFLKGIFTSFFKKKVIKKSQNRRNQGFSYYFCLMMEGSGSIPLAKGSGSERPKKLRNPTDPDFLGLLAKPYQINVKRRSCATVNTPPPPYKRNC